MPMYLKIAEQVYENIKNTKGFSADNLENLNNIMMEIRKEISGTTLKLIFNYIDFEECFLKRKDDTKIRIDFSLIPHYKNKDEFILWLAGFIEKITTGGKRRLPPIKKNIPINFKHSIKSDLGKKRVKDHGEKILAYFSSTEFNENISLLKK